jgi:hypothetical protein
LVGNDFFGPAMIFPNVIPVESGSSFSGNVISHWDEISLLGKAVNHNKNYLVAVGVWELDNKIGSDLFPR